MSTDGPPVGPDEKPDLRFSAHQGRDVKVSRELSSEGHLARGDHTRMSRLNFSARARPADPGERDVSAFGGRQSAETDSAAAAPPAGEAAADPVPAEPAAAESPPDAGLLQKMGRLFGR